jgi:branched-subunit amino acid ABC-type transport system permease component
MASIVQYVLYGLEIGSYIAVSAVAFTLVYGLVGMLHIAHAEYMIVGSYLGVLGLTVFGLSLPVTYVFVLVVAAVVGWLVARGFYRPIHHKGPIALLFTSVAVGFVLRFGIQLIAGPEARFYDPITGRYRFDVLGGLVVTNRMLLIVGTAVVVVVALHLLLTRTDLGIALRAMGADEDLARVTGIRTTHLRNHVWLISSGLAGLSGFLLSMRLYAAPRLGISQLIVVIAAAILGGAGSPYGAVLGAYIIGIVISVSTGALLPAWGSNLGTTIAFVVLIGILLVKPGGLTGADVTAKREEL